MMFLGGNLMMPKNILSAMAAAERTELYYMAHPGSPSAVRRPKLSIRSGVWVALLGESVRKGIVGLGATVEMALAAFDAQYLKFIRQPETKPVLVRSRPKRESRKSSRARATRL